MKNYERTRRVRLILRVQTSPNEYRLISFAFLVDMFIKGKAFGEVLNNLLLPIISGKVIVCQVEDTDAIP